MFVRFFFLSALFLTFLSACGTHSSKSNHSAKAETTAYSGPVTLDSSAFFSIYSKLNNQNYRMRVRLPASYTTNPNKQYPVVLKLDGQWDFLLAASAYNCIYFDGQMPETIFVGIDWGDVEGDIHAIRSRDFMHVPLKYYPESGNADRFIKALGEEIFPELKKRYRTDGRHFLIGSSMSANFATYAIFKSPETFDGAIAIGPNFSHEKSALEETIKSHKNTNNLAGKKLYIGTGKRDYIEPLAQEVVNFIKSNKFDGFELRYDNPDQFGHSGMNIPGYAGGYQFLFKRPDLKLSKNALSQLAGVYKTSQAGDKTLTIKVNNDALEAQLDNQRTYQLKAESENRFYFEGEFFNLVFEGNNATVETFFGTESYQSSLGK